MNKIDMSKFDIPCGKFVILTPLEITALYEEGLLINSKGNRENGMLSKDVDFANFCNRLYDAKVEQEDQIANGIWDDTSLGENDVVNAFFKDDRLFITNGWHRILTLVHICSGNEFKEIKTTKSLEDSDVKWFNKNLAGKTKLTAGKIGRKISESPIPIKIGNGKSLHERGSNRVRNYSGAENLHSEYYNSVFAKEMNGMVLYKKNQDCPEFFAMTIFSILAQFSGPITEATTKAFNTFSNSKEAAMLVKECAKWYQSFNFLRSNQGRGKSDKFINIQKFRGICYIAFLNCMEEDFAGMANWTPKTFYTSWKDVFISEITSASAEKNAKLKLDLAKMMLKQLKSMTNDLRKVDSALDAIKRHKSNASDKETAGIIDWIADPDNSDVYDVVFDGGLIK